MAATKRDLIDRITESTGETHVVVKAIVQDFLREITARLSRGNRLESRDFGVFETKAAPARMAQNPRTGEKTHAPARRKLVFKPGRLMREGLNGGA
jgi:integration host factor subunit beta